MAAAVTIPAWLMGKGVGEYNKRALGVKEAGPNSTIHHMEALGGAAINRAAQIAPEAEPLIMAVKQYEGDNLSKQASHAKTSTKSGKPASQISINPNADAAYFAHELGHAVSQKTGIGNYINKARHTLESNPKLGKALYQGLLYGSPIAAAALQEGDDDLAASMAIAAAVASPKLIDEALASKNALAIMNDAGLRASLGQRGRLAGGYLSYLAPVLIAGSLGNFGGNVADDYTAIYDL